MNTAILRNKSVLKKKKQHFPKHEQSISDIQDEHLMEFSEQKFFISAVWCYDTISVEKYNLFMTAHEKKTFTSHSFVEIELKTFITETVIAKAEYVWLKNNYFLYQELHYKKLLHYFENAIQIYVKGPILLMKKNANLTFMFFENLIWTLNTRTIYIKRFKEKVHGLLNIYETINLLFTSSKRLTFPPSKMTRVNSYLNWFLYKKIKTK